MTYLKSYHSYELRFPMERRIVTDGGTKRAVITPEVILPRRSYKRTMVAAGKRNIVALSDDQIERLRKAPIFNSLLKAGERGGYVLLDSIPDHLKTADEHLADERAKNARLEAELAAAKGEKKVENEKPTSSAVDERRKEIRKLPNKALRELSAPLGIPSDVIKRPDLIEAILKAEAAAGAFVYAEAAPRA